MVDKDLFLYNLAVVAIMKCEGPYLKEWLDYHLAAGVDHFYIYDNESPDNQAEVAAPYVEAGLVDYFPWPGEAMQTVAYNDALKKFKFQCRYMAFIDGDEFIYPKAGQSIAEVVDEILSHDDKAAGLAIHWNPFDSNGQEKADYSRPVLERFTRCPKNIHPCIKTIANPRKIGFFKPTQVHTAGFFRGFFCVDENLNPVYNFKPIPATADKIVLNHYHCKSLEEYIVKIKRGDAVFPDQELRSVDKFHQAQINKGNYEDGIIKYRDARLKIYQPPKPRSNDDLIKVLEKNLPSEAPPDFYAGKMETFLTCRAIASYLQTKLSDNKIAKFYEEVSLNAALKAFVASASMADRELFIMELPTLLRLPYAYLKLEHIKELFKGATDFIKGQGNITPQELESINLSTNLTLK